MLGNVLISLPRPQANSMKPNNEELGQAIELHKGCGAIRQTNRAATLCKEDSI
jgi:hypothetical protein